MTWTFGNNRMSDDDCAAIEPLLPLYADGMASPEESRRVDAHLPGCGGCRETLAWMQATHRALAARPIALPPPDLHSRIAEAIAASSAAPSLRPARSFTLRPAYAAAASLTVLGIALSYSLWHIPSSVVIPHTVPPVVASVPVVKTQAVSLLPKSPVKMHRLAATTLPAKTATTLPARTAPARKTPAAASVTPEPRHLAVNIPAPVVHPVPVLAKPTAKAPDYHAQPSKQLANNRTVPAVKHAPIVPEKTMPKTVETQHIASRVTEPAHVSVVILPPTVTTPQTVQTAFVQTAGHENFLDAVNLHARDLSKEAFAATRYTVRVSGRSEMSVVDALKNEHEAYVPGVWTR